MKRGEWGKDRGGEVNKMASKKGESEKLYKANMEIQEGLRSSETFKFEVPSVKIAIGVASYYGTENVSFAPAEGRAYSVTVSRRGR